MASTACSISFSLTATPSFRLLISSDDQNESMEKIVIHFLGHIYYLGRSIQILNKKKITFSAEKENFSSNKVALLLTALQALAEATNKQRIVQNRDPITYLFPEEHPEKIAAAEKEVTAAKETLEKTVGETGISYEI